VNEKTRYERSVEIIKPLVYRIVWPTGSEELVSGAEMLEKGITYLNEECEIYEYEHMSATDRAVREQLEVLRQVAFDLVVSPEYIARSESLDAIPALKKLRHELDNYDRVIAGKPAFAPL
jgi:hypothetical protein